MKCPQELLYTTMIVRLLGYRLLLLQICSVHGGKTYYFLQGLFCFGIEIDISLESRIDGGWFPTILQVPGT